MPEENLTTSTGKQVDFLGGASETGSTMQWGLEPSPLKFKLNLETSGAEGSPRVVWVEGSLSRDCYSIDISSDISSMGAGTNQETAKWTLNPLASLTRILCHVLIER